MLSYKVVQGGDLPELSKNVQAEIDHGWKPQGGVCSFTVVERDGYGTTFYNLWFAQAMVEDA